MCDSLLLHSLEFEDVHSLGVAGRGQEHAVHAEGQGADAHTPAGGRGRVTPPPARDAAEAPATLPGARKAVAAGRPRDRRMGPTGVLGPSITGSKHLSKQGERPKGDGPFLGRLS